MRQAAAVAVGFTNVDRWLCHDRDTHAFYNRTLRSLINL